MKTITRLAHLVLKLLHIPPSAAQIPKHVSNLIVSCAEFQARPPICSSPCSWEPLLCSSLTKISLPTKKINNKYKMLILFSSIYSVWAAIFAHTFVKVFARASISANIIAINCENVCARFDLCLDLWKSKQKYLRMLGFAQIFAQMLVKKNTLASICALICANIFENPCARSDLRFDLRKSMRTLWFAL